MEKKLNNLPLDGIVVLDLTNVLSGPFATFILAELGAKIIKIEKPSGDDSRLYGPFKNGESGYFISLNRGKKSIVLDLKKSKDKNIFKKLLKKSDILIDNYKNGVLEKFGFPWSYLSKNYPRLIHGRISGFGETGPLKSQPAYDIIVQAMGGLMSITGNDKNNMVRVGTSIGDIVAGLFCVIGILSQLIRRNKTQRGSKLDLSMLDCQVAILENAITRFSIEGSIPQPLGTHHPSITPFGSFKTKNGNIVLAVGNEKLFNTFCKVIDDPSLIIDKRFNSNKNRNINLKKMIGRIEKKLKNKTSKFWIKKFTENKIPCSNVNTIDQVIKNKQIIDRKMILNYPYNNMKVTSSPFNFNFIEKNIKSSVAPKLNENEEEILKFIGID